MRSGMILSVGVVNRLKQHEFANHVGDEGEVTMSEQRKELLDRCLVLGGFVLVLAAGVGSRSVGIRISPRSSRLQGNVLNAVDIGQPRDSIMARELGGKSKRLHDMAIREQR